MSKLKIVTFVEFFVCLKASTVPTKFQKISLNGLNFNSFKLFLAKKPKNVRINFFVEFYFVEATTFPISENLI